MTLLHCCSVRADVEVYAAGVHAPLVVDGVVGRGGAAVVPQPHEVQTHLGALIADHWRTQTKGVNSNLFVQSWPHVHVYI